MQNIINRYLSYRRLWIFLLIAISAMILCQTIIQPVSAQGTGTISGIVFNMDTGQPFPYIRVDIGNDSYQRSACTDINGDYTIDGVPLDIPLIMSAGGLSNYCGGPSKTVWTHWEQTVFLGGATPITLTGDLTGIDFWVEIGGTVSGRVVDQDTGQPIANMVVSLGPLFNGVCTDVNGNYTLFGIPLETLFDVRAGASDGNFCGGPTNYVDEYWREATLGEAPTWLTLTSDKLHETGIDFTLELERLLLSIDIKPGSDPNCFNNNGHGVIPVAILGRADFDVTQVDPNTVELEGMAVRVVGKKSNLQANYEDVNNDGFADLVVQIEDQDGTFEVGEGTATLTAYLFDGTPIEGSDSICVTQ